MHKLSSVAAIMVGALGVLNPVAGLHAAPARASWTAPVAAPDDPSPADLAKIGEALAASFVRVEFTVQYDKGESPGSDYYGARARYAAYFAGGEYDAGG